MPLFTPGEMAKGGKSISLSLVPKCGACGLHKTCKTKKMKVFGKGRRKVLIIGEAPGATEDAIGRPFVGDSGQILRTACKQIGVNLDDDCWSYNAIICRPPGNELPESAIDHCRANVLNTIKELDPEKIILLGTAPVKSLIGHVWKEDPGGITRWAGMQIPAVDPNSWICPTYHPAFILRARDEVPMRIFTNQLRKAFALEGRPWTKAPDYEKAVRMELDDAKAAASIRVMMSFGKPIAFDYETNMIKPDSQDARIACCSVSSGDTALAFLWRKEARKAMGCLLKSQVPKIGYNMKFEDRWTIREFGHAVRNFMYDGMLDTHVLDYRTGVCSLKFQAFVLFGADDYAEPVKEYLQSKEDGGNSKNRVFDCPVRDLLLYCGVDSFLEWKVWNLRRGKK
jgi:uracil-DNA glycosylase family 4